MNKKKLIDGTCAIGFAIAKKLNAEDYSPVIISRNIDSKMSQKIIINETIRKAIENMRPIPKTGQGDDFGDLSSFIISKKNSWITEQILHIDGVRSNLRIKA